MQVHITHTSRGTDFGLTLTICVQQIALLWLQQTKGCKLLSLA